MRFLLSLLVVGCARTHPAPPESAPTAEPGPAGAESEPEDSDSDLFANVPEPESAKSAPPETPRVPVTGSLSPASLTRADKGRSESYCTKYERRVRKTVDALSGPCTTADDCELLSAACPLGCYHVVSKLADRTAAKKSVARFFRECHLCVYKCPLTPRALACVDEVCVMVRDPKPETPPTTKEILSGERDSP